MKYDETFFNEYHGVDAFRCHYPDENVIRFLAGQFPSPLRPQTRVLDLGCGCGRHLSLLGRFGFQAHGVDGSRVALEYAQGRLREEGLPARLAKALVTELPYADESFGAVIEHAVLVNNPWEDILRACRECRRVLQKGGVGFFLLKRLEDCAFAQAQPLGGGDYLIPEEVYLSRNGRPGKSLLFHAFSREDIDAMFAGFSLTRVHTWDMSFKELNLEATPNRRLTAYWIVLVQK